MMAGVFIPGYAPVLQPNPLAMLEVFLGAWRKAKREYGIPFIVDYEKKSYQTHIFIQYCDEVMLPNRNVGICDCVVPIPCTTDITNIVTIARRRDLCHPCLKQW